MSRAEYITSVVFIIVLLCIGAAVVGYRFLTETPMTSLLDLLPPGPPPGWQRLGQAEEYPAYRLNEKIDGEDIEFLSRDCLGLAWAAYTNKSKEGSFIAVSIYDMAEQDNARSIYESVRGPLGGEVKTVRIGDEAYIIAGSLFFRQGRYYVQLQAGADDSEVASACDYLARLILERIQAVAQ